MQEQQRARKREGFLDTLAAFIANIPQKRIAMAGRLLGLLAYILDTRHRRIVKRNLQFVHPEWSRDRVRDLSISVFKSTGVTFLEICQTICFSRDDILRKVRIRGEGHLLSAMKRQKGVIMISAHLGNWEMGHMFVRCYFGKPVLLVARQIESRTLRRWINGLRARFGGVVVDKKRALPRMARALQQERALMPLLIDQGTRLSQGVEVTFFGRTTTATPAAALLARRYDTPVLPVFCVRGADAGLTLVIEPPLCLQRTEDPDADLKVNTQLMTSAIEKTVRAYPEQWFWFHKRWKRHYPYLYREDLARRQRRKEKEAARSRRASAAI